MPTVVYVLLLGSPGMRRFLLGCGDMLRVVVVSNSATVSPYTSVTVACRLKIMPLNLGIFKRN